MKTTPEYVKEVIERRKLDRLAAYDATGRHRFDLREGTAACVDAVAELVENTEGPFIVDVWKHGANGRRALADSVLRYRLQGAQKPESVNGAGAGPSWREFMDLKLDLLRQELAPKEDASADLIARVLPLAERLILGAASPAQPIAQAAARKPAPAAAQNGAPDELREVLAAVAVIYRKDPDTFRGYAPLIVGKAQELAGDQEQPGQEDQHPADDESAEQ